MPNNPPPKATHIGELKIGDLALPCAVLPDGTRVLSQGGVTTAFGPVTGGYQQRQRATIDDSGDLPAFLVAKSLKAFISDELRTLVSTPRKYRDPRGGPFRRKAVRSRCHSTIELALRLPHPSKSGCRIEADGFRFRRLPRHAHIRDRPRSRSSRMLSERHRPIWQYRGQRRLFARRPMYRTAGMSPPPPTDQMS